MPHHPFSEHVVYRQPFTWYMSFWPENPDNVTNCLPYWHSTNYEANILPLCTDNEHIGPKNLTKLYQNVSSKITQLQTHRQCKSWVHGITLQKKSDSAIISSWMGFAHVNHFKTCLEQTAWMDMRRNVKLSGQGAF